MKRTINILAAALMSAGLAFGQAQTTPAATGNTQASPKPQAAASATQSTAPSPDKSKPTAAKGSTKADDNFAKKAAAGGIAEVELAQVAAQRSSNAEVKLFAQRMIQDHMKANDQLKAVAGQVSLQLPSEPMAKDKALKARLEKLSGDAFDRAYINAMVTDHKKDVADFEREAKNGKDDNIRNFAAQTLPTLQDHLKQALDAQNSVRASKTSGAKNANASASGPQ